MNSDEITRGGPAPEIRAQAPGAAGKSTSSHSESVSVFCWVSLSFQPQVHNQISRLFVCVPPPWKPEVSDGGLVLRKKPGFLRFLQADFFPLLLQLNEKDCLSLLCSVTVWNQPDNECAQSCRKAPKAPGTITLLRRGLAIRSSDAVLPFSVPTEEAHRDYGWQKTMLEFDSVDIEHPYSMFL